MRAWIERQGFWASAALICVVAVVLMAVGLYHGSIITQSSVLNTVWSEGFAHELAAGRLYPHYLPEMNDGRGSPVFYFYAPLPFYFAAPLVWLTGDAALATVMCMTLMLGLSGFAGYALFRDFVGRFESFVIACFYMAMPYHFVQDIWLRGAFGEQASFIFLPVAILCLRRLPLDARYAAGLALATAGQLLSHLPTSLFYAVVLAGFSLWTAWSHRSWKVLILAGAAGLLGAMAATVYVVPALYLQKFINTQLWTVYRPEDLYSDLTNWKSRAPLLLVFVPTLYVFVRAILALRQVPEARQFGAWVVLGALVVFLVSPLAVPFWLHAGPLRLIQFPWRALAAFDLATCVLAAGVWRHRPKEISSILSLLALIVTFNSVALLVKNNAATLERERVAIHEDAPEYLPSCLTVPEDYLRGLMSTKKLLEAYRRQPLPAGDIRAFYYPFLKFSLNGKELEAHCDPKTGLVQISGLAPDEAKSVLVSVRPLPVERPAMLISLLGVFLMALLWLVTQQGRQLRAMPLLTDIGHMLRDTK